MDPAQQNSIAPLIEETDKTQEMINSFVKSLKDLGLADSAIQNIILGLVSVGTTQTTAKVSLLMNDEDFIRWKNYLDSAPKPNPAQQLIVLNEFLKDRSGKDLNTIHVEILEALMKDTLSQIEFKNDLVLKSAKLSDSQIDLINNSLDQNDYENAQQLLNKFSENNQ